MGRPPGVPVTVDIIIELDGGQKIVLIERKNNPKGWAIPGGFVDPGESLAEAARREAREETGLIVTLNQQFFTYSKPGRDSRGPVVSVVFIGSAVGTPVGADDAKRAIAHDVMQPLPKLAFDHKDILEDYFRYKLGGARPGPSR